MARPHASHRYTRTAIVLHWLLAAMLLASFVVGTAMTEMALSPTRLRVYNMHKWAGIVILGFTLLRLAWRLTHRPPPPLGVAAWQRAAASAAHGLLYALCIVVPLVGWAYSSAAGFPVVLFGVLPLPDWIAADREMAKLIKPWHARAAWLLGAVVLLHVAAAMKHHMIDRDGLLNRMLPGRAR